MLEAELDEIQLRVGKDHPATKKLQRKLDALTVLEAETLESMLMSEIRNGNFPSQAIMVGAVNSYMWGNKKKMKTIFEINKNENASKIIELANAEKLDPKHAAELLHSIHVHTDLDVTTLESSEAVFIAALSDSDRLPKQIIEFAMENSGNSPEFVKAVYGLIHEFDRQDSVADLVYKKLTALKPDQLKVIVPMIPNQYYYKSFKNREYANPPHNVTRRVFELIAAFGEHAVALKDDFEQFETWNIIGDEYLRAIKKISKVC